MDSRVEHAVGRFSNHFNCGQSVLSAFAETYGLDEKTALRLASGLGAGFRCGEVCGAVSGAVLVIGLKEGQESSEDLEAKNRCNLRTEEFLHAFREQHGSILCRDLLGCDLATAEGRQQAKDQNLFATRCKDLVAAAVRLLEEQGH